MLEIGSIVDEKYKVLNVLGKGGTSVVYLVMNEKVNKQWAIKEIVKDDFRDFEIDKKEIAMMKKLKHSHLPSIVDVIEKESTLLIVMDYIEGRSLDDILMEQGAQPMEQVIVWAQQLCDVLKYLHSQNPPIIYRDMKPGNVMLKPDGKLMLIDFGAAREFKIQNMKDTISLGTRGYAAPEQYRENDQSDARTDLYCLGVMLFQLLTGESPHELCPIRTLKPELSSGLEKIILKCTQVKKEDRYQSAEELLYAIEHYWEYDEEYRKRKKQQLLKFMFPMIMTIVLAIGTVAFGFLEYFTRKNNYEEYLKNAAIAGETQEKALHYAKAINLNPKRPEAYQGILQNCILEDGKMTGEESRQLKSVLNEYGNGKQTNESIFRSNSKEYGKFAYDVGIAYFYRYEDKTNKSNAKGYFEAASEWGDLNELQKQRAERLYAISNYYATIGVVDAAGDATITYLDYWNDLTALSLGNLVEQDNERTALVMYEEIVCQIISRTMELKSAGVTKNEINNQLNDIQSHLETDFLNMSEANAQLLLGEIQVLKEDIEMARKIIQSAYGREGE